MRTAIFLSAFLHFGSVLSGVHAFSSASFCLHVAVELRQAIHDLLGERDAAVVRGVAVLAAVEPEAELDDLQPQAQDLDAHLDAGRARVLLGRRWVVVVAGAAVGCVGAGVPSSANAAGTTASARTISARGAKRFI